MFRFKNRMLSANASEMGFERDWLEWRANQLEFRAWRNDQ